MAAPPPPEGGDDGVTKLIELMATVAQEILPSLIEEYIKANREKVLALLGFSDEDPANELAESAEGLTATDTFADLEGEDVDEED
jgi:hypothetical protein